MVLEEIDLTGSDDEEEGPAPASTPPPQPPHPVTPIKCKSEDPSDAPVGDGDDGLTPATTGGKGLWSLWTRNFKSPLLMLLDLVDNAVDAAMPPKGDGEFTGRVHIYRDLYEVSPGQVYTTGLCLRNNSHQKIAPMKEVLQLFISAKANSGSESIGENGVGLKQSCAALGDNSFVLGRGRIVSHCFVGPDVFELIKKFNTFGNSLTNGLDSIYGYLEHDVILQPGQGAEIKRRRDAVKCLLMKAVKRVGEDVNIVNTGQPLSENRLNIAAGFAVNHSIGYKGLEPGDKLDIENASIAYLLRHILVGVAG